MTQTDVVGEIIDALIAIEKQIPTPAGQARIERFYDEPPAAVSVPCFVNVEIEENRDDGRGRVGSSVRIWEIDIAVWLLFAPFDEKYSRRAARAWVAAVRDTFDRNLRLGDRVQLAWLRRIVYNRTYREGDRDYVGAMFEFRVKAGGAFTYEGGPS